MEEKRDLASWVEYLSAKTIPVLPQTVRSLDEARQRIENVSRRELSDIVMRDPLMALRILACARQFQSKRQIMETSTVAHALMVMGTEPFFEQFKDLVSIESVLQDKPEAMIGMLFIIRRGQRAAKFSYDWAAWRRSQNVEEIFTSALLYDVAEILMWIYAPDESALILRRQRADSTLRSAVAQEEIFGFRFNDLQKELCRVWELPELLSSRFDPELNKKPNFLNVSLAIDLARHSASGWENAALPDDFTAIENLLNINRETLLFRLGLKQNIS